MNAFKIVNFAFGERIKVRYKNVLNEVNVWMKSGGGKGGLGKGEEVEDAFNTVNFAYGRGLEGVWGKVNMYMSDLIINGIKMKIKSK